MEMRVLLALALSFALGGLVQAAPLPENIDFKVYRDGDEIGHHRVTFARDGEAIIADVDIELAVTFAGIRVFHYHHASRETWSDGKLLAIDSSTNNDGDPMRLSLRRVGDELQIDGTKFKGEAAGTLVPTSYWFKETVNQSQIIDTQNGRIFPCTISRIGRERIEAGGRTVEATRYTLSEQLTMNLWYDDQGNWVKTSFESGGSLIDYVLEPRQQRAAAD